MIGSEIIEIDRIDSTNAYAARILEKDELAEGTIIVARDQFAGRGQQDNDWLSEPGKNLTFTLILYPRTLPPDRQFLLNKTISLAVLDFVRSIINFPVSSTQHPAITSPPDPSPQGEGSIPHPVSSIPHPVSSIQHPVSTSPPDPSPQGEGRNRHSVSSFQHPASSIQHPVSTSPPDPSPQGEGKRRHPVSSIKWPNDIYIDDRKIAGILIENRIMGSTFDTALVGIGVNVNQERFSQDLPKAGSIIQFIDREVELKEALISLCNFLDRRYALLQQFQTGFFDKEYCQNLYGYYQWREFFSGEKKLEGKIQGVDDFGHLIIETRNGEIRTYNHKSIEFA
ncbi:MAG: hypothetical protein M0Q38_10450 [Bacteroidales bacterium]|jgi:biotin-(acetyl-CoA carboxylase) ligase|nr:hypothetical protein [Bacteroidales bacterium]